MIYFQILEDEHGVFAKEKPTQFGLVRPRGATQGDSPGDGSKNITVSPAKLVKTCVRSELWQLHQSLSQSCLDAIFLLMNPPVNLDGCHSHSCQLTV